MDPVVQALPDHGLLAGWRCGGQSTDREEIVFCAKVVVMMLGEVAGWCFHGVVVVTVVVAFRFRSQRPYDGNGGGAVGGTAG